MTATEQSSSGPVAVRCTFHPEVETLLRCSRCGTPICPRCGIRTPVGMRCPRCAGVAARGALDTATLARAVAVGLLVAVPVGVVWGLAPDWGFYLALALGFGSVEAMAKAVPGWRGPTLQAVAIAVVLAGLVLSRVVLASRLGVDLGSVNQYTPLVQRALYLQLVPDVLFMALPVWIAWVRFR